MATKLYFHNAANSGTGTFPVSYKSGVAPNWIAGGSYSLKKMDWVKGTSQVSVSGTTAATTSQQLGLMGAWASPALDGAQSVGTGTITINVADAESNTNSNFSVGGLVIYVWRPSTGTQVGMILNGTTEGNTLEATAASSEQVSTFNTTTTLTTVSAQDGDIIVCEVWSWFTQSMSTSYTATMYFDGTTENTTENAVVTSHASYVQLNNDTLRFKTTRRVMVIE